jgi:hypothetical protein
MGFLNPQIQQGNLNRLYTSVFVPNFVALSTTASYMAKSMAQVSFAGDSIHQIPTAVGVVNSPEPYLMAKISISLLRSQPLAATWLAQFQAQCIIGPVTIYSDSSAFPSVTTLNTAIENVDPGAYDGGDPTFRVTLSGQYYINSAMWTGAVQGGLGAVLGGLGAVGNLL